MTAHHVKRLDSWKDIAVHLGRDVSTVIRWEKERGLPVHRVPGGKHHAVFAYADEIDAWLAGAGSSNARTGTSHAVSAVPTARWHTRIPRLVQAGLIALLIIGLYAGAALVWKARSSAPLAGVGLGKNGFEAQDQTGKILWTYPLPQTASERLPNRTPGIVYIDDLAGDGNKQVLVSYPNAKTSPGLENERQLYCFSEAGKLLWRFDPQDTIRFVAGDFGPPWYIVRWLVYRSGGQTRIALVVTHHVWWPSVLVILDAGGHELARYVNSGDILSVATMETPSGLLLLAGGVSNANGPSGFLAVLDGKNPSGTSPEKPGSGFECKSCPPGRPLHYFIFPRSELNLLALSDFNQVSSAHPLQSVVEVQTEEAAVQEVGASAIFEFSRDFRLRKARWSDGYPQVHRELEREGKIKHSWEQCPDRFGPRLVRSWDPQHGWTEIHPNH